MLCSKLEKVVESVPEHAKDSVLAACSELERYVNEVHPDLAPQKRGAKRKAEVAQDRDSNDDEAEGSDDEAGAEETGPDDEAGAEGTGPDDEAGAEGTGPDDEAGVVPLQSILDQLDEAGAEASAPEGRSNLDSITRKEATCLMHHKRTAKHIVRVFSIIVAGGLGSAEEVDPFTIPPEHWQPTHGQVYPDPKAEGEDAEQIHLLGDPAWQQLRAQTGPLSASQGLVMRKPPGGDIPIILEIDPNIAWELLECKGCAARAPRLNVCEKCY